MAERLPRGDEEALAQRIQRIEDTLLELSTGPLIVPIVDTDPPTNHAGNIWAYPDGKLNLRLKDGTIKQYTPVAPAPPPAPTGPAAPQPVTRQSVWDAQWGQAYRSNGGFTGGDNSKLYQGSSGDSYNGRQRSLIGFDYASIQAALAGSQISQVEVWLYMSHTYWNNGGTVMMGMHNNTGKPGSWAGTIGRDDVTRFGVPKTGGVWRNISTEFGARLRDGSARGLTMQAPSDDRTFYLYAAGGPGTPSSTMPKLRITYVK